MNRSSTPPPAKTSASPIVATVRPTAPAASWRRPNSRLLCVLACGRSATPRSRMKRRHPGDVGVRPIEVHDDRRGLDPGPGLCVEPGPRSWPLLLEEGATASPGAFVGRYRPWGVGGGPAAAERLAERQEGAGGTMSISAPKGLALESIADVDPALWDAMLGERRRQHDKIELIASENYVSAAVMRGAGLVAHQQVRRGPAGQALLRRLRVRRRRRAPRPGARPRPVPGQRARQRPAPLGRPGQHGGLLQRPPAR